MTDDAELRARIEARVEARRQRLPADPAVGSTPPDGRPGPTAPERRLEPDRPWLRDTGSTGDRPPPRATPRPSPRNLPDADPAAESEVAPEPAPDAAAERERMRAFALRHAAADAQLAQDSDAAAEVPEVPRRRRFGRRHAAEADPAEDIGSESGTDADAADRAARHAADETSTPASTVPAAGIPAAVDETVEPPVPDVYPWQRKEDVDLDLKGAPTWNPADYPDGAEEPGLGERGKRAARWLLARRPGSGDDTTEPCAPRPGPTASATEPLSEADPVAEQAHVPIDVTDAPDLDVDLADELSHPPPDGPAAAPAAPPELPPARPRPRPRPAQASAPPPPPPPSTESDPPPRPRPGPGPASAAPVDPEFARFMDASEHQPGDDDREKTPPRRRMAGFWSRFRRPIARVVVVLVIVAVAAFGLRQYVVAPYFIPSPSMEPTLHGCPGCNDDRILVDKVSYRLHDPRRKDIVVFDRPKGLDVTDKVLIKRVIGLPGDKVDLRNGLVYVNGAPLDEPYLNKKCGPAASKPLTSQSSWTISDDDVFVMGDNRCNSEDSRAFGPIPKSTIVGRAWFRFWPLSRFGTIG